MVFLQFPSNLTEEELMLKSKYAKLKKVRKKSQDPGIRIRVSYFLPPV